MSASTSSSSLESGHCFGECPGWNLAFPNARFTAAELLAYLPNSIRNIDVIDRLITNGGTARTMAALINEFRTLPGGDDACYPPNSVLITMKNNMRRAGHKGWTPRKHGEFARPQPPLASTDLNVGGFRLPHMTHPMSGKSVQKNNKPCDPLPFKDLARHIKRHPSGDDALDLARCVQHAANHPDEEWIYPNDWDRLVKYLDDRDGPINPTPLHLDAQVFERRADWSPPSPPAKASKVDDDDETAQGSNMGKRKCPEDKSGTTPEVKKTKGTKRHKPNPLPTCDAIIGGLFGRGHQNIQEMFSETERNISALLAQPMPVSNVANRPQFSALEQANPFLTNEEFTLVPTLDQFFIFPEFALPPALPVNRPRVDDTEFFFLTEGGNTTEEEEWDLSLF